MVGRLSSPSPSLHRRAFLCGIALLVVTAVGWAAWLVADAAGRPWALGLPAVEVHGLALTFGFMPSFFAGFLFTMAPRWLRRPPLPASALAPTLAAQAAGWALFLAGAHASTTRAGPLAGLGLGLAALGWVLAWARLIGLLRAARDADRAHLGVVTAAGGIGAAAMIVAAAALALDDLPLARAATLAGLWIFVGGTFAGAAHRMIGFLGSAMPALEQRLPHAMLHALAALFAIEGSGAALEAWGGPPAAAWRLAQSVLETGAGAGLLALCVRWRALQGSRARFIAMLQSAFCWLALAFLLAGASHAGALLTGAGAAILGATPLHAYTVGFLGTTMLAMVSRVACGHAGRAVVADELLWRLFLVLQAAAVARVGGGLLASFGSPGGPSLIVIAACLWAAAWSAWALRVVPWLARAQGMRSQD